VSLRSKLERLEAPKQRALDELRVRIQAIFERTTLHPRALPEVDTIDLPFATLDGPLHVRTLVFGAAHRVGHAHTFSALSARSDLLSLLALDPLIATTDLSRALYLDTETTGLSGGTGTVPFLVGLAFFRDRSLVIEQLLVRRLGEEAPMLARVRERIEASELLVTFNGKAFDLPLLRTRFVMNRLPAAPDRPHLDLLHLARRIHKARRVACKLTMLESTVLGFEREGDVPSGEVSAVYLHFLRTGDARALLGVVEHNLLDVVSMAALVGLYGEPLSETRLAGDDLAGVARTLHRAGAPAMDAARLAVERGRSPASLRARADIAKAIGERDLALADYEAIEAVEGSEGVRFELAKLYEHHQKSPRRALAMLEKGIKENDEGLRKRRARLERKLERGEQTGLFPRKSG
jgi:uncharacterized protein YprB with RNaseH-like and TPR domain